MFPSTTPPAALPSRRRWHQFSLRTLLVATALVAAALGLFVVRVVIPGEQQRSAVQEIDRLGGWVEYGPDLAKRSWWNRTLRQYLPQDYVDDVVGVGFRFRNDNDLSWLSAFSRLQFLDLSDLQITANSCARLADLTELRYVSLSNSNFNDASSVYLAGLDNMEELFLDGTQITDATLYHLRGLTKLRLLRLNDHGRLRDGVTADAISVLQSALPDCVIW